MNFKIIKDELNSIEKHLAWLTSHIQTLKKSVSELEAKATDSNHQKTPVVRPQRQYKYPGITQAAFEFIKTHPGTNHAALNAHLKEKYAVEGKGKQRFTIVMHSILSNLLYTAAKIKKVGKGRESKYYVIE